ncbi:hypothetical protein AAG570_004169 [Ranatra chinensis]|uniref:Uncharacterized protein n=1 Tax=Ranatra chinensis TaxID=642074 RepID=A0ABD0YPU1_9HEMI
MSPTTASVVWPLIAILPSSTHGVVVCYGEWWFCLERNGRRGLSSVYVQDHSTSYTRNYGRKMTSLMYDSSGQCVTLGPTDIRATSWNITYNGETFGFMIGSKGPGTYNLYTRNLTFTFGNETADSMPVTACQPNTTDRVDYPFWWIERKSKNKCPVVLNRDSRVSPLEWNWPTDVGGWRIQYHWDDNRGIVTGMVFYNGSQVGGKEVRLVIWQFNEGRLTVAYIASPTQLTNEDQWKMSVKDGETFGFVPGADGQWNFNLYSSRCYVDAFKPRVWIPCHSFVNVQAKVADTASGRDPMNLDGYLWGPQFYYC